MLLRYKKKTEGLSKEGTFARSEIFSLLFLYFLCVFLGDCCLCSIKNPHDKTINLCSKFLHLIDCKVSESFLAAGAFD